MFYPEHQDIERPRPDEVLSFSEASDRHSIRESKGSMNSSRSASSGRNTVIEF